MNRLPTDTDKTAIIYDNKEQNNDRLLDRHFLFNDISRSNPFTPNTFISSSRKKGLTAYNEAIQHTETIYESSLFNNQTPTQTRNTYNMLDRSIDINRGRTSSGWINFSDNSQQFQQKTDSSLDSHIFDTLGYKHTNHFNRPIAQPSNPWTPNTNP
jgi:hypothetical protein